MRKGLLVCLLSLIALAGCGDGSGGPNLPAHAPQDLYVVCSGKPRWCAVADLRDPDPEWKSATELTGDEAVRYRRLVDSGGIPLAP